MVKARLTRKKPNQAPSKKTEQKPKVSAEQLLSDEVPKVLSRYKGNKYNISKASKLVKDLQAVIVRACCIEPTWQKRVAEIHYQLMGKTLLVPLPTVARNDGYMFVSAVGILDNQHHDTLCIDGIFAKFGEDGSISYVRPATWYFPLRSTCVRDEKLRVFLVQEHRYVAYPLLSDAESKAAKRLAKMILVKMDKRLDEF